MSTDPPADGTTDPQPYASSLGAYRAAGWLAVLPVPAQSKTPPPAGFTGEHGRDPSPGDYALWVAGMPHWSVALRMPDGIIGIDVDDYTKGSTVKRGAATLTHFEQLYGPLPATWSSTARGPGASRIHFYRAPSGRFRSMLGPDVEIIQRHHRYAVVAPSWHHDVGAPYCWYDPNGQQLRPGDWPPSPSVLAELPAAWAQGLREGAAAAGSLPAPEQAGHLMLAAIQQAAEPASTEPAAGLAGGSECAEVYSARLKALDVLGKADPGSRHDLTTPRVHHLVMLGAKGHPGAAAALSLVQEQWERLTVGEGRGGEFERMLLSSARKAVTDVGRTAPLPGDPCLMLHHNAGTPGSRSPGSGSPGQPIASPAEAGIFNGGGGAPGPPMGWQSPAGAPPPLFSPPGQPAPWGTAAGTPTAVSVNGHASPGRVGQPQAAGPVPTNTLPLPAGGSPWWPAGAVDAPAAATHQGTPPAWPPVSPPPALTGGPEPGLELENGGQSDGGQGDTFSTLAAVGVHAFDPPALLDQPLADAVLERIGPVLRYATDSGGWVVRENDRWLEREDMAGWAVGFLARFAPAGDPGAGKGSPEAMRAARRVRLLSTAGRNAVAAAMRDVARGGQHPSSVRLAELDNDPELLWAGGTAWNLRTGQPAGISPATPHLHTAACAPAPVPTPLWDAYLSAVWPDPEIRAWAVRVLSVAVTGYPDAALPILLGPTRHGKSATVALVMSALGTYAHAADKRVLGGGDNCHPAVLYALKGRRLSFVDEAPRGGSLAQEQLKQITGGAPLTAHAMRSNPVTFEPTHTLVLTADTEPNLTDPALRARVRLIPCEGDPAAVRAARRQIGPVAGPAWRAELPGVLYQLMREAAGWLDDRDSALTEAAPVSIRERADELAAEQDPVREWVEEDTEPWPACTRSSDLYEGFVAWWRRTGRNQRLLPSTQKWGRDLTAMGIDRQTQRQGNTVAKVRPLRLRSPGPGGGWGFTPPPQPSGPPVASDTFSGIRPAQPTFQNEYQTNGGETPANSPSAGIRPAQPTFENEDQTVPTNTDPTYDSESAAVPNSVTGGRVTAPETETADTAASVTAPQEAVTGGFRQAGPASVTDISVTGQAPVTASVTKKTPSSTYVSDPSVTDVTVFSINNNNNNNNNNIQNRGNSKDGNGNGNTEPPAGQANKPARAAERKATKAAEREAARLAAVQEAQGPLVTLPAVLDRQTQSVTEVSVAEGRQAVLDQVAAWAGKLTVDVETSGYPIGHPAYALRTVQLGSAARVVVWDTDRPDQAAAVAELLASAPHLEAHSAQADLVPLVHAGLAERVSVWTRMWDTVIPAKLADPQQTGADPSLKAVAPAVLGSAALSPAAEAAKDAVFAAGRWLTKVEPTTPPQRSGWAMIDKRSTAMVRYAGSDVLDTAAIGHLVAQPSPELWDRERTAQRATARIAHDGLALNPERVRELTEQHTARCAELAPVIRAYGIVNPGSPPQVAAALAQLGAALPLTAGGRPSAAKGSLEPLRAAEGLVGRLAQAVLDWRHADTALKLFLRPWQVLVDYDRADPRVRSTVYTLSADTGRMSSVRFNLQQLSRQGGIRSCIQAMPGYVLVSADFQGVEVRTMAALSQDPTLIRLLTDGRTMCPELAAGRVHDDSRCGWCTGDLHRLIAAHTYGPDWAKEDRYNVKRGVFGWAYGGTVPSLAAQIGVRSGEMQSIVDVLAGIAPTYVDWAAQLKRGVRRGMTQFPTYSGRVVHLDGRQPHKAPNFAIQGSARELLVDALIQWHHGPYGGCVTVPVHDEIVAMVPEDKADHATAYLQECMTNSLYGVPILAEPSQPSVFWADAS